MRKDYFWTRFKRKILKNVWVARIGIILSVILLISSIFYLIFKNINLDNQKLYFKVFKSFLSPNSVDVKNKDGRINILVLGKSSKDHAGSELTDSIIFVSLPIKHDKINLISIPRDVWVPDIRAKINSAYYWGNQKKDGGGIPLAKNLVENLIGQPVHYAVVIDFAGFKRVIDALGGIDVNVINSFIDEKYPIEGRENDLCAGDIQYKCRYERLEFTKGVVHMNGDTALKFVRSRNSVGDEGTDIARGLRQQQVVTAIKNKVFSSEVYLSPSRVRGLIGAIIGSLEIDFDYFEGSALLRYAVNSKDQVSEHSIDSFVVNPPISAKYDKQYVFVPKSGSWAELQKWVESLQN